VRLEDDPRWRRFNDRGYACPCCGQSFSGIFDIAFDHPDPWPHGHLGASGQDELIVAGDRLTADLCWLGEERYIRCTLPLPLTGSDQEFRFGCWVSLSVANFERYVDCWRVEDYAGFEGAFGWLSNRLPGVGPVVEQEDWLPADVWMMEGKERPQIWVHRKAGRLHAMQREGIGFDELLDIYAACGTDLRPHLADV